MPGDPNEVGSISVGLTANVQPLLDELEKAKAAAKQKGEEIGQAASEGVATGTKWNYGSMHGPSDADIADEQFKRDMASAKSDIDALSGSQEQVAQTATAAAASQESMAVALGKAAALYGSVAVIAEKMILLMGEETKIALEAADAVGRLNMALERQLELQGRLQTVRSGDPQTAAGSQTQQENRARLETEIARLEAEQSSTVRQIADSGLKVLRGAASALTFGEFAPKDIFETPLEASARQAEELRGERDRISGAMTGIRDRSLGRSTGAALASAMGDSADQFPTLGRRGDVMDQAAYAITVEGFKQMSTEQQQYIARLMTANHYDQQQIILNTAMQGRNVESR